MSHPTKGVNVDDHKVLLKTYYDTFTGSDAKEWMVKNLAEEDKPNADQILDMLLQRGMFH
jgi:hypothetical protein